MAIDHPLGEPMSDRSKSPKKLSGNGFFGFEQLEVYHLSLGFSKQMSVQALYDQASILNGKLNALLKNLDTN
jgi:hypothetical protein